LHDTMLQSFQGLLLRFQTVLNLLPGRPEEAMVRIGAVIEEGSQAIAEGRDAVHELRSVGLTTVDLAESIRNFAKELLGNFTSGNAPELRVQVQGVAKDLDPVVRDEVYRIAAEALRNAIRHADAKKIEVDLRYDEKTLTLVIHDDGRGIDTQVLDKEHAPGHWGLRGMRERAKLIGGSFEIWSKPGSGTEIELKLPAERAYAKSSGARRSFLSRSPRN
jgi:signal transduction histidine kinase